MQKHWVLWSQAMEQLTEWYDTPTGSQPVTYPTRHAARVALAEDRRLQFEAVCAGDMAERWTSDEFGVPTLVHVCDGEWLTPVGRRTLHALRRDAGR